MIDFSKFGSHFPPPLLPPHLGFSTLDYPYHSHHHQMKTPPPTSKIMSSNPSRANPIAGKRIDRKLRSGGRTGGGNVGTITGVAVGVGEGVGVIVGITGSCCCSGVDSVA